MPHLNIPMTEEQFRVHEARKVAIGCKSWATYIDRVGDNYDEKLDPAMQAAIDEMRARSVSRVSQG